MGYNGLQFIFVTNGLFLNKEKLSDDFEKILVLLLKVRLKVTLSQAYSDTHTHLEYLFGLFFVPW